MKLIKKILTILILLFNVIVRRTHYRLTFVAEHTDMGKLWYYHFPVWGFDKHNLLMVSGADALCEHYSEGKDSVSIDIVARKKPFGVFFRSEYDHYIGKDNSLTGVDKLLYGRNYDQDIDEVDVMNGNKLKTFWICPVTLFVLGRYPNHIYIKKDTIKCGLVTSNKDTTTSTPSTTTKDK